MVVRTPTLTNISIGDKFPYWGQLQVQAIVYDALNIPYDVFEDKHVVGARGVHVKTHLLNNIRDVRAGGSKILQGSCKTLI